MDVDESELTESSWPLVIGSLLTCFVAVDWLDGGKLEVWDPAAEASSPLCSVSADTAAIVQIVVRVGRMWLSRLWHVLVVLQFTHSVSHNWSYFRKGLVPKTRTTLTINWEGSHASWKGLEKFWNYFRQILRTQRVPEIILVLESPANFMT